MKKRTSKSRKIKILLAIVILAIIIGIGLFQYNSINKLKVTKLKATDEQLKVSDDTMEKSKEQNITNILLLGVDKEENASDTIMVFSIDNDNKKLKLTSIMRDSYIFFGEDKVNKINYAYHYGGPELTIKTINENYNLDIMQYIKVDFSGLDKIVDIIGGVEIDVKTDEIPFINSGAKGQAAKYNMQYKSVNKAGKQVLDGNQALSYSRIRKIDSDYNRTQRQRNVMQAIFNKFRSLSPSEYPKVLSELSSYIETNINTVDLMLLGNKVSGIKNDSIKELRLPIDGSHQDSLEKGIYYLKWDKDKNLEALQKFIYEK